MKFAVAAALALVAGWNHYNCHAAPVTVDFVNASRATRCAEEDNVYVKILGSGVSSFRISAEHPPYIAAVDKDSTAPDFSTCDMSHDPSFAFAPRKVTLYESAEIRLVGHRFANFWRPDVVEFRVGEKLERGLHLVQLIKRTTRGDIEILVVYPADGYWRAKPLPPPALKDTAYGSSFLFGPVEESTRPYVPIRSIHFEPATMTFRLAFRNGGRGVLKVADASPASLRLALTIAPPVAANQPFAALRSMYVTPAQADVAVAQWPAPLSGHLPPKPAAPSSARILDFQRVNTASARFGRTEQSRHNLSAPDMVFDQFATTASRN